METPPNWRGFCFIQREVVQVHRGISVYLLNFKNEEIMMGYYILIGAIALFSWLVSARLKSKFKHYSKVHLQNGMSGAEIAQKMLDDHGIRDVKVISTPGLN